MRIFITALAISLFTITDALAQVEYKVITSVESIVPMYLTD